MAKWCALYKVAIWAYCLMPNHVHLIAVPSDSDGLRKAIGEAHRRYTWRVNQREEWRGYLWQGRFSSYPMDQTYLLTAARYIEMNPVRVGLAQRPEDYPWSSARAHLTGKDDILVSTRPLLEIIPEWGDFLRNQFLESEIDLLRKHNRTGRPLGHDDFIRQLEQRLGRILLLAKPGRKPMAREK